MLRKLGMLFFVVILSFIFAGCAKKPVGHFGPIHNQRPAKTTTRYVNSEAMKQPHQVVSGVHWRCTVGNHHQTWHGSAATLVAAQTKAKNLCEQMSAGHGICRYKGCVQVVS